MAQDVPLFRLVLGQNGSEAVYAEIDSISGGIVQIDAVHQRVHQGKLWDASIYNAALADAGNLDLLIQTGSSYPHTRFNGDGTGAIRFLLYEGVTVSDAGAAVTAYNRNRNSVNALTATITSGPTISDIGTPIAGNLIGAAGGGSVGSSIDTFEEFVLKPNEIYLARLTNISGGAIHALVSLIAYEGD